MGKISEYGGKEKYKSKAAKKKHESGESMAMENAERKMPKKMSMGGAVTGTTRGTGAARKQTFRIC